jgi:hypothetical protein
MSSVIPSLINSRLQPYLRVGMLAALLLPLGCMKQYKAPTMSEPHAILKVRRHYATPYGSSLSERVIVNGEWALKKVKGSALAVAPQTDALLVHPRESNLKVTAVFSHQESRLVSESYSCGSSQYPRTCTRLVSRQVTVIDSSCDPEIGVRFEAGSTYLVELDQIERGECSLRCYRQIEGFDKDFQNEKCDLLPMDRKSRNARE